MNEGEVDRRPRSYFGLVNPGKSFLAYRLNAPSRNEGTEPTLRSAPSLVRLSVTVNRVLLHQPAAAGVDDLVKDVDELPLIVGEVTC